MLYISTRNNIDSYTAYRALHEETATDGGFYTPFQSLKPDLFPNLWELSATEAIAQILNSLFGLSLTGWDVECAIGRTPFQAVEISRRTTVVECWRNPGSNWNYLIESLYACMCGKTSLQLPARGWARVAIEIAILFGLCVQTQMTSCGCLDLCIAAGDFSTVAAALYAKDMGLPIGKILCVCDENGSFWDLIHRGEMNTGVGSMNMKSRPANTGTPGYFEYLLHRAYGADLVVEYLNARDHNGIFRLDEELLPRLSNEIVATVVSVVRTDAVVSSIYRTNGYIADPVLAFTYGGLQDYRSGSGIGNHTLLLGKESPALSTDRLTKILNLSKNELMKQINFTKE